MSAEAVETERERARVAEARLSSAEAEAAALRQALRAISTLRRRNDGFAAVRIASDALEESDAGAALLARLASLTAALEKEQQRNAAWEAVANGMADVIRVRGEALEPFVRFHEAYKGRQDSNDDDTAIAFNGVALTLGDLRRAAEITNKSGGADGE